MDIKTLNMLTGLLKMKMNNNDMLSPDRYILFLLNDNVYSLRADQVGSVTSMLEMTEFKNLPPYIRGYLQARGTTIPVIDLRVQSRPVPIVSEVEPVIMVIDLQDTVIGLIVDKILEVVTIPDDDSNRIFPWKKQASGFDSDRPQVPVVTNAWSMLLNVEKILKSSNFKYLLDSLSNVQ